MKKGVTKILYFFIDFLAGIGISKKQKYDILLIRVDAIGDFVLWTDTLRAYEKQYKDTEKKVVVLCLDIVAPIAKKYKFIDKVISLNYSQFHKNLWYRFQYIRILKSHQFEVVFSPVYSRFYGESADYFVRLLQGNKKIGFDGNPHCISKKEIEKSKSYYTNLIESSPLNTMELIRNAEFVQKTIDKNFTPNIPNFSFIKNNDKISGDFIVIVLGAGNSRRRWPVENFAKLILLLPVNLKIILLGSAKEFDLGTHLIQILKEQKDTHRVVNHISDFTLMESMTIVKGSKCLIGNESSMIHIAAALRVHSIAITGGGHWKRFVPYSNSLPAKEYAPCIVNQDMDCYGCDWQCKYPLENGCWKCINNINIEVVYDQVKKHIKASK
ncbi:MAG: glycosyltransferase family 9 protein [Bacteroidales bacterium]